MTMLEVFYFEDLKDDPDFEFETRTEPDFCQEIPPETMQVFDEDLPF